MVSIEKALIDKASRFSEFLSEKGYGFEIGNTSGYGKKVIISNHESDTIKATIYFKPSKSTFTLIFDQKNDELAVNEITELWHMFTCATGTVDAKDAKSVAEGHHIYVDGSYADGRVGYGLVAVKDGRIIKEYFGPVNRATLITSRQVGGEITAVIRAIEWCKKEGISSVVIHHDFENLEKWVIGAYKARTDMTSGYRDFVRNSGINITWKKVAAHTGNFFNERADELARKGALTIRSDNNDENDNDVAEENK